MEVVSPFKVQLSLVVIEDVMKKVYLYLVVGSLLLIVSFFALNSIVNKQTSTEGIGINKESSLNLDPNPAQIANDPDSGSSSIAVVDSVVILFDSNANDSVRFVLTDSWEDGSSMDIGEVDNIIYIYRNGNYYRRKFDGPVLVSLFGAKGDGKTDDTEAIQKMLDSDYKHIAFEKKTYLVRKNTKLSGFPNNDQPCLLLINKDGTILEGNGATIKVQEHAQGILEVQKSTNVKIRNLNLVGAGNFPKLDGNTGRGEKGTAKEGYYTSGFWGYYKNNSNNTSSQNRGGFSGRFPQFDGQTGGTWGVWNGGYIGNVAYGLLIHNGSHDVVIEGCSAKSFNYVGIGVGHNGDYFPKDLGYKKSTNITFRNCKAESNYSAGFHSMDVEGFILDNSLAINTGHPNASISDKHVDPGYGYTSRGSRKYTNGGVVEGSRFANNRRKGLDVHAGNNITFRNNSVSGSWVGGVFAAWSNKSQPATNIKIVNNAIDNCGGGPGSLGAIYVGASGSESKEFRKLNAIIDNNKITNYSKSGIWVRYGHSVQIRNNKIENSKKGASANLAGILVLGLNENDNAEDVNIVKNTIKDNTSNMPRGIQLSMTRSSTIDANVIDFEKDANVGLYTVKSSGLEVTNNKVSIKGKGTAIAVPASVGKVLSNSGDKN
ncbi:right-handed parallel beta-helix repeat-containing protein [Parapedobacter deserti]|uniref:Right-handed parallel beta-helix repeat-containing protein n=1 Tax=Parapedobacter deserti TaxID=1912957 RepID=A0ABV7JLB8_9SPHI